MNSKCGYIEIRKHVFEWINGVYIIILYYILSLSNNNTQFVRL